MPDADWPVDLRGVTETVVTTLGSNERWNVAALGVNAPADPDAVATARTWGQTRTRRNFAERGEGYVQFTADPETFARAALTIVEVDDPILDSADAWARAAVERRDAGQDGDSEWIDWALTPIESAVVRRTVPKTNRGYGAVVEATVAASRLDVDAYDRPALESRLSYLADVIETCGGPAERRALAVIREAVEW